MKNCVLDKHYSTCCGVSKRPINDASNILSVTKRKKAYGIQKKDTSPGVLDGLFRVREKKYTQHIGRVRNKYNHIAIATKICNSN